MLPHFPERDTEAQRRLDDLHRHTAREWQSGVCLLVHTLPGTRALRTAAGWSLRPRAHLRGQPGSPGGHPGGRTAPVHDPAAPGDSVPAEELSVSPETGPPTDVCTLDSDPKEKQERRVPPHSEAGRDGGAGGVKGKKPQSPLRPGTGPRQSPPPPRQPPALPLDLQRLASGPAVRPRTLHWKSGSQQGDSAPQGTPGHAWNVPGGHTGGWSPGMPLTPHQAQDGPAQRIL